MDDYAETVRALTPLPGVDGAYLPGHIEAERMSSFTEAGIPVSDEHKQLLDELAQEIGIEPLAG